MIHTWAIDAIGRSLVTGEGLFRAKKLRLALCLISADPDPFQEHANDRWIDLKKIPRASIHSTLDVRPRWDNVTRRIVFEYIDATDFSTYEGFSWDTVALLTRDNRIIWSSYQGTNSLTSHSTLSVRCPLKEEEEEHWDDPKYAFSLQF